MNTTTRPQMERVHVCLPTPTMDRLRALRTSTGLPMGETLRRAADEYVARTLDAKEPTR